MTTDEPETFVPGSPTKLTAWNLLGIDPDHPGVAKHTDGDVAAAEARGYRKAIANLRNEKGFWAWFAGHRFAEDMTETTLHINSIGAEFLESLASPNGDGDA